MTPPDTYGSSIPGPARRGRSARASHSRRLATSNAGRQNTPPPVVIGPGGDYDRGYVPPDTPWLDKYDWLILAVVAVLVAVAWVM